MINKLKILIFSIFYTICLAAIAEPKTTIEYGYSVEKLPRIRVINETNDSLYCYIAIDGYKRKFIIHAHAKSKWYKATDQRFNFSHFSTWCDYASRYPQLKP